MAKPAQKRPPERSKKIADRTTGIRISKIPSELGTRSNCLSKEKRQVITNVIAINRMAWGTFRQAPNAWTMNPILELCIELAVFALAISIKRPGAKTRQKVMAAWVAGEPVNIAMRDVKKAKSQGKVTRFKGGKIPVLGFVEAV